MTRNLEAVVLITHILLNLFHVCDSQAKVLENFTWCGGAGIIGNITVNPCPAEPCEFRRGITAHVDFVAQFSGPSEKLRLRPLAIFPAGNVTLPGVITDLCKSTLCPITENDTTRAIHVTVPIMNFFPLMSYPVVFMTFSDNGLELCIKNTVVVK